MIRVSRAFAFPPACVLTLAAAGLLTTPSVLAPLAGPAAAQTILAETVLAQSSGSLSGPGFVEAAGVYSRFQMEAGAVALRNTESEAVRSLATRTIAEFERVSSSLRVAAESAAGHIAPPTGLDGTHEVWLERLRAAKGEQFDALYAQIQAEATTAAKGVFTAYADAGDQSTLKAFAEETLPVIQRYSETASKIQIRS